MANGKISITPRIPPPGADRLYILFPDKLGERLIRALDAILSLEPITDAFPVDPVTICAIFDADVVIPAILTPNMERVINEGKLPRPAIRYAAPFTDNPFLTDSPFRPEIEVDSTVHQAGLTTGVDTVRTKLREVKSQLSAAYDFVGTLIQQAEQIGHNGGPKDFGLESLTPTGLEQLRPLHTALGELLEMADAEDWDQSQFEGLIADTGRFLKTVQSGLIEDKPYAAGLVMISALIAIFSPPVAVGVAASGIIAKGIKK